MTGGGFRERVFRAGVSTALAAVVAWMPGGQGVAEMVAAFHVDGNSSAASDRNPGTAEWPVRTIRRGVRLALAANAAGRPATVYVHPGTYRESVLVGPGGTDAPLTIEAMPPGRAVVSGSDVWTGWTRVGATPVFVHDWPYAWGLAPVPRHWPALAEILRRREMVFVAGQALRQVTGSAALDEGTFYVDDVNRRISIWPEAGTDPNSTTTEVAVRPVLLSVTGRGGVTVRGLVFQHAATAVDRHAVEFDSVRGLRVVDTVVQWNNWGGLGITDSSDVAVLHSAANHNGARGMDAYRVKSVRYEDDDTSYNNWRGAAGDFTGWATAGIKGESVHGGIFLRHRAVANDARGFWLDTDNADIRIEGGVWCDNRRDGAQIEASQGPIEITDTVVCHNAQAGVRAIEASNVTLRNSALYGNREAQFTVSGPPSDIVTDWETGRAVDVRARNLTLCGNAIVAESAGEDLLAVPPWRFLLQSLRSSRNTWWNPQTHAGFRLDGPQRLDLSGWHAASGQDADSVYADPQFADPAGRDVRSLEGSAWRRC